MKLTSHKDHFLPTGVLGLTVAPDGSQAFAACVDGSVQAVDLESGKCQAMDGTHVSYASGCVLLPDGRTLISGGYDGQLLWHDIATRRTWRRIQAHAFWSWQLALSPDGTKVASVTGQYLPGGWKYEPAAEQEPSLRIYDTHSGALLASFSHGPPVLSCAFSPDGTHVAAANMMGEVRVWELSAADQKPAAQWNTPDFTSWGSIKTHHYCGGIYSLAFAPDGGSLLCCGMGPMSDPMAGNGKMTWQRRDWRSGSLLAQIKDGQHGNGLMETLAWHPDGKHFVMAGRQAQGTWNAALFSAESGELIHSMDTKKRITQARWTAEGNSLVISGSTGQPQRKLGLWPPWGRVQCYRFEP